VNGALLIARRELAAYVRSPLGSIIIAAALLLSGILFYVNALSPKLMSEAALSQFFFDSSGVTTTAALLLSFRLIAEERQTKTFTLLNTAPIKDWEIVLGKYLSALVMVFLLTVLNCYMPALLYFTGKVSLGHIAVGYLGLLLIGSAAASIGLFASCLTRYQVLAAIIGALILAVLFTLWMVAQAASPPISDYLAGAAFHHLNFRGFQNGILELRGVAYYTLLTYLFLFASTKVLSARRWR
jgi:ABC-2 type transport system permease protein